MTLLKKVIDREPMQSYQVINTKLEMTRRISPAEEQKINARLAELPQKQENAALLVEANNSSTKELWEQQPILHDADMPLFALLAFQNNLLDEIAFSTLLLYWSAVQCHGKQKVETYFLNDNDDETLEILRESLFLDVGVLKDDEIDSFIEEFKKLPPSEQRFFLVPDIANTIVDPIEASFRIFGRSPWRDKYMVPSLGMMQAYLRLKYKYPVKINPVIGLSSLADIRLNGLNGTRDMGLHFPYVYLPSEADTFLALWYLFAKHDFYHAALVSSIPDEHRKFYIYMSDQIKNDLKTKFLPLKESLVFFPKYIAKLIRGYAESPEDILTRDISDGLIDMEHSIYRVIGALAKDAQTGDLFWESFANTLLKSIVLYQKIRNLPYNTQELVSSLFPWSEQATFSVIKKIDSQYPAFSSAPSSGFPGMKKLIQDTYQLHLPASLFKFLEKCWHKAHIFSSVTEVQLLPSNKKQARQNIIDDRIIPYFSLENIFPVFYQACENSIRPVQQACMIYMTNNFTVLMEEKSFKEFQENRPQLFKSFIRQILASRFCINFLKDIIKLPETKLTGVLDMLLSARCINQLDKYGCTLLDYAVEIGSIPMVQFLLSKGANPNPLPGSKAKPTLFSAIYHAHGRIFNLLRKHGFDMSLKYQSQTWREFYQAQCDDPNTFCGISQVGKSYALDFDRVSLFCQAKQTARINNKAPPPLLQLMCMSPSESEEYQFEMLASDIDWACRRLGPM